VATPSASCVLVAIVFPGEMALNWGNSVLQVVMISVLGNILLVFLVPTLDTIKLSG